jgi:RNA polymerase sigma-70 factor (ECF subfamily)
MSGGKASREGDAAAASAARPVVYCLIPAELGPKLHDLLQAHFRDEPAVEVVIEQRDGDRRSGSERRLGEGTPPTSGERRRVRGSAGRRVAERRAALVPTDELPQLPLRVRRFAQQIAFVERLEPSTAKAEDLDTARLVARFQAGDRSVFDTLYTRYFSRVYAYLRVVLRDTHEAEDATQQVFIKLFEALPKYERRGSPFRAWLFSLVRHHALDQLRRRNRIEMVPLEEAPESNGDSTAADDQHQVEVMNWLSDRDLQVFVDRLPLPQRQILVMRYMLGFSVNEIAAILDKKPNTVSALQSRAFKLLEQRLSAIGRAPAGHAKRERSRSRRWVKQATVLRARRFALTKF